MEYNKDDVKVKTEAKAGKASDSTNAVGTKIEIIKKARKGTKKRK